MRIRRQFFLFILAPVLCVCAISAQSSPYDIPLNTEKTVTTLQGIAGLPASLGKAQDYLVVLRIAPLAPGRRYEATITYDAGTDIYYAHSWLDGNPFGWDWYSFGGLSTGTGRQELRGKQEKFLFTVDAKSTSGELYVILRSDLPFTFRFGVSDKLSGASAQSKDKWGYFYVQDFDADHMAPFLLKRGGGAAAAPAAPQGPWTSLLINAEKTMSTAPGVAGLPSNFGSPQDYLTVLRISPLVPGRRYEATFTYDAGTDISYAHSWFDGDPFGKNWFFLGGLSSGTGRQAMKDKREKFLFSIDARSISDALYLVIKTDKPLNFRLSVSDKLTGVTAQSKDAWGYFYVQDFDADHSAPFLLKR